MERRFLRFALVFAGSIALFVPGQGVANDGGGAPPVFVRNCDGPIKSASMRLKKARDALRDLKKGTMTKASLASAESKVAKAEARLKRAEACK